MDIVVQRFKLGAGPDPSGNALQEAARLKYELGRFYE